MKKKSDTIRRKFKGLKIKHVAAAVQMRCITIIACRKKNSQIDVELTEVGSGEWDIVSTYYKGCGGNGARRTAATSLSFKKNICFRLWSVPS